jgi:hypothetical protein
MNVNRFLDARLRGPCIPLRAGLVQGGHDELRHSL